MIRTIQCLEDMCNSLTSRVEKLEESNNKKTKEIQELRNALSLCSAMPSSQTDQSPDIPFQVNPTEVKHHLLEYEETRTNVEMSSILFARTPHSIQKPYKQGFTNLLRSTINKESIDIVQKGIKQVTKLYGQNCFRIEIHSRNATEVVDVLKVSKDN